MQLIEMELTREMELRAIAYWLTELDEASSLHRAAFLIGAKAVQRAVFQKRAMMLRIDDAIFWMTDRNG